MTRARKELVSLADTPYYHCVCRCVRRAFRRGADSLFGRGYFLRKHWAIGDLDRCSRLKAVARCV